MSEIRVKDYELTINLYENELNCYLNEFTNGKVVYIKDSLTFFNIEDNIELDKDDEYDSFFDNLSVFIAEKFGLVDLTVEWYDYAATDYEYDFIIGYDYNNSKIVDVKEYTETDLNNIFNKYNSNAVVTVDDDGDLFFYDKEDIFVDESELESLLFECLKKELNAEEIFSIYPNYYSFLVGYKKLLSKSNKQITYVPNDVICESVDSYNSFDFDEDSDYNSFLDDLPMTFSIEGTGYKGRTARIEYISVGDILKIEGLTDCPYFADGLAIEVFNDDHESLGYLSISDSFIIRSVIDNIGEIQAKVVSVTPLSKRRANAKYALMDIELSYIDANNIVASKNPPVPAVNMQDVVDRMNADLNDSGVSVSFEPLNAYDENDEDTEDFSCYSLGDGTAMISEYYGNKKEVNIPERINGLKIVGIKTFAFPDNDNVDIINIPKSIEFIDVSAFPEVVEFNVDKDNLNYTSCDGVIYNKDITSLVRYPARNKRNEFVVPESVKTIEGLSFIHANHLKKLYLSQNIKKFNKCVFGSFDKIDDIYYEGSESDWSKVVIEEGNDCLDGKHINQSIIHFNHKEAFNAKSKTISKEKSVVKSKEKSGTTDYTYTVLKNGTAKIKKYKGKENNVTIPSNIDGYVVTSIGNGAFKNNKYMKKLTIPGEITIIGAEAFRECENLKEINILNGVKSIGDRTFSECGKLETVNISSSVKKISVYSFIFCNAIKNITVDSDNEYYSSEDGVLFNKDKTELIKYPAGNDRISYSVPEGVTSIMFKAFAGSQLLENVTLPDSLEDIADYAFSECSKIESVIIPKNVVMAETAFPCCENLKEIIVNDDNKNLISKDGVLFNHDVTELIQYPNGITQKSYTIPETVKIIKESAFSSNKYLEKVNLFNIIEEIEGEAFGDESKLGDVYFAGSKREWQNISISYGNYSLKDANLHFSKGNEDKTVPSSKKISETIKNDLDENAASLIPTQNEAQVIASLKRSFVILEKLDLLKNRLLNEASEEYYDTVLNSMNLLDDVTSTVKTIRDISIDEEMLLDFIRNNDIEILANVEENMRDVHNQMQELYDVYSPLWKKSNVQNTNQNNTGSASSSSDANSGGCYIATCVYGSYDCPEVWTLRRFRDYTLAKTWHGRAFIHTYYALAPTLVKLFGDTKWFKSVWQSLLDKKIQKLNDDGVKNTPYQDIEW